jgi:outer membrane protein
VISVPAVVRFATLLLASWICCAAAIGAAETLFSELSLPDVSLLEHPALVKPSIPVVPVREREVWFRDTWDARINAGYETDKDLGQIATGSVEVNSDRSSMIGLDVGRPLVDDFRDWPVDFAWRTGVQRWLDHGAGAGGFAQTAYLKMYVRPFPWEHVVSTRIGIGEGLSYAWRVPEVERKWASDHNDDTNRLMNYLDVSLDLNVGDIIRNESARACKLGLVISHRSGVFGLVDIFGNVHNGSNYNTAALECGF